MMMIDEAPTPLFQDIRFIVSDALQTFNEDKTGRADFALEALGGTVISIGCTG